jgi:elongation factor G
MVIDQMSKRLAANVAAIQVPYGKEQNFIGIIDIIDKKLNLYKDDSGKEFEIKDIPVEMMPEVDKARMILIEKLAEVDDKIMDDYLHNREISAQEIKDGIRKAVIANKFVPVLCGSAFKNKGVQLVLDAVRDYLPSPVDLPPIKGTNPDSGEFEEVACGKCGLKFFKGDGHECSDRKDGE